MEIILEAILLKVPNKLNVSFDAVPVLYDTAQCSVNILYHGLQEEEPIFASLEAFPKILL
jgi:hypothetical protein